MLQFERSCRQFLAISTRLVAVLASGFDDDVAELR
jgi:hypothetical protein